MRWMPWAFALLATAAVNAEPLPLGVFITATAVDPDGFMFVAGRITNRDPLPTTPGVFQASAPPCSADTCTFGFVAKITPAGANLVWATYVGLMDARAQFTSIALAPNGNVYVASSASSASWLPPLSGYQSTPGTIFVGALSSDGKSLVAGTYLGGHRASVVAIRRDA